MNSRLRRIGTVRAVGLGVVLASLAIVLIVLDPSPAPAAFVVRAQESEATPVAVETIESSDDLDCGPETTNEIDTVVDTVVDSSSMEELATPIALPDPEEANSCGTEEVVPEAVDTWIPESDVVIEAEPAAAFEDHPETLPDQPEAVPPDATAEATDEIEDPTLAGLPVEFEAPPSDPSLLGIPASEEFAQETTTSDPMLTGVTTAEVTSAPPVDPSMVGLAEVEAAAVVPLPQGRVDIDVTSPNGTVIPGGRVSYIFRVSNPRRRAVSFKLQTTVDRSGWSAAVYAIGSATPLTTELTLKGGAEMQVVVIVSAAREAVIGDRASTELNAVRER